MSVVADVEQTLPGLEAVLVVKEFSVLLLDDHRELGVLGLKVVVHGEATAKVFNVLGVTDEGWRLLVDPEGRHHRWVILMLWWLFPVDGGLSLRVAWSHREPAAGLGQH